MSGNKYAVRMLAVSDANGQTIERIFVNSYKREEIRFSWWKNGRFIPRPLDLPESELLPLMKDAIKRGVFSPEFLAGLRDALKE